MRSLNNRDSYGQKDSPISLRPGSESDFFFITRLSRDVFDIYGPYDKIVQSWFLAENTITVIADSSTDPVGFAMLGPLSNRYDLQQASELLAIAVNVDEQGKGIGGLLLEGIEKKAVAFAIQRIFLHTAVGNHRAGRLFKRMGYRPWEIKRAFYPGGQDAIVMSKETAAF